MLTARISAQDRPRVESELLAAMAPENGWPKPDGDYARLIVAEQRAGTISMAYLGIPPIFRDAGYSEALLNRVPGLSGERREHAIMLRIARDRMQQVRRADPSDRPAVRFFMPFDALNECARVAPDRLKYQAAMLLTAMDQWDLRVVPPQVMRHTLNSLGNVSSSIVLSDLPDRQPPAVYTEFVPISDGGPHEDWSVDRSVVAAHRATHDLLTEAPDMRRETCIMLGQIASGGVYLPAST